MKIKMAISIIAIGISSMSIAEAGQNHHKYDRHYDSGHHGAHYRKNNHRSHWKRERHAKHHYREQRHYRKHHYDRHKRSHRYNTRWERSQRTYNTPRIYRSHRVVVRSHGHSNKALPIVAGGLIGSAIANNASHGDPAATFGGAVFGALVGKALSHH